MSCLDNIIGIDKKCSPDTPSSGLYLQNLPGVTVKLADVAADEETASGVDLINEKITYAKDQILQDVREYLLPHMKVNSVIESETVGYYHDNLESVAADVGYRKGIQIKIDHYPYLEFYINSIKLQSASSGATSIYIYNLTTGKLLDTIAITTVADVPTEVIVQKAYKTDSYAVFNNIMISSGGAFIESNKRSTTYTSGLSVNYSINCSIENFVCNMSNLFAWPILQKTGAELMRELMFSRRLNSIIIIDKAKNEQMREEFDAEYVKSMDRILKNISIPDDVCFKCKQRVKNVVRVP
jgi:hypothetical protein